MKLLKTLNYELAYLAGAHAAYGTLTKSGRDIKWQICDGKYDNIARVRNILLKNLNLDLPIKTKNNAFLLETKCKVFCDYMRFVFNFPLGEKHSIVKIPLIIKNSNDPFIKLSFVQGFLDFDGCITKSGGVAQISAYSLSKDLIFDVSNVLKEFKIEHAIYKDRNGFKIVIFRKDSVKKYLDLRPVRER